jgi:hypothetical protein
MFVLSKSSRWVWVAVGAVLLCARFPARGSQDADHDLVAKRADIGGAVDRLEKRCGEFQEAFDDAVSRSMIDGTELEVNAKHRADDLQDAAKRLVEVFHEKRDKNDRAVRDEANKTIAAAVELNRVMIDHSFTDKLQREWALLRSDLNALAEIYDHPPLGLDGESQ